MHMRGGSLDSETARVLSTVRGSSKQGDKWATPGKLHHLGWNNNRADNMAQYVEAAAALYTAYEASEDDESAQGSGNGGAPSGGPAETGPTTGIPQPGSTATAISPTFQTQISPQISPVFQQTQASPGAVQAATATQYMPGGMFAEGGSAAAAPGLSPYGGSSFPDFGNTAPTKYGGLPVSPLDPVQFTDIRDFRDAGSVVRDIRESTPFNWTPVYWIGGFLVAGALGLAFMKQKRAA